MLCQHNLDNNARRVGSSAISFSNLIKMEIKRPVNSFQFDLSLTNREMQNACNFIFSYVRFH